MSVREYKQLLIPPVKRSSGAGNDPSFHKTMESLMESKVTVEKVGERCVVMMPGVLMPSLNKVIRWHPIKEFYAYNKMMRSCIQDAVAVSGVGRLSEKTSYVLVVRSARSRLLDVDNIPPKFIVDGIIHAGILPDDNPTFIAAEVIFPQQKVKRGDEYIRVDLVPRSEFDGLFCEDETTPASTDSD